MTASPARAAAPWLAALLAATAPAQTPDRLDLDTAIREADSLQPKAPQAQWIAGTGRLALVADARTGKAVVELDPWQAGARRHRFASPDLARALRAGGAADASDDALPPHTWLDGDRLRVERADGVWHWTVGTAAAERVLGAGPEGAVARAFAADDAAAAVVSASHDLWIVERGGRERRITWDGAAQDIEYGGAAHRAEFGIREGLFWSPTGRFLAFYREDMRAIAPYPDIDYGVRPPRAVHGRYPMAGAADSVVTVGVYDRDDGSVRWLEHDPDADLYWTNLTFAADGGKVFAVLVDRGQTEASLVRFDCISGKREATLLVERDPEWIEPEHGPLWLADGGFLWLSPRSGHWHLHHFAPDGRELGQVTRGEFDVAEVIGLTADGASVLVAASGDDPRTMHVWSAAVDGGGMRALTRGRGRHEASLDPTRRAVLSRWSSLDDPGHVAVLAADDGRELCAVGDVDLGRLRDYARCGARFFDVAGDDGIRLHGMLTLPPGFEDGGQRRYPLLLYVYAGPHSQLVTDTWQTRGPRATWLYALASQGVVVATVDGRGTRNRGIEFEQAVYRRLSQLEVRDQVAAVHHLCEQPWVDPDRVGVHGWSYGGYMTLALMLRAPDLFRCGIAGAPVTDWRMYETGYTERYMDTPQENPDGYREAAMATPEAIAGLHGRLLLIHGSDDQTVMLSHAVAFLDAAVEQGALIDHMLYPMQRHGVVGDDRVHLYRLMSRYLSDHLLGGRDHGR